MTDDELTRHDCVVAIADLCGRSGAKKFEIGWLYAEDEVLYHVKGPCWYASARYRGARIQMDGQATPELAADGLAHRILDGGRCMHCGHRTTTAQTDLGTFIHAAAPGPGETMCVWRREGPTWKRGCEQ